MARLSARPDIIEIHSDDDGDDGLDVVSTAGGYSRQNGTRKPNGVDSAKRDSLLAKTVKTPRINADFAGKPHVASPASSKHATVTKHPANGSPRFVSNRKRSPSPMMSNGRSRGLEHPSNGAAHGTTKETPVVVNLLDDEDAPFTSRVALPYAPSRPNASKDGPQGAQNARRSNVERLPSPSKRTRDGDSPSASANPPKKRRLSQNDPAQRLALKRGNASGDVEQLPSTSRTSLPLRSSQVTSRLFALEGSVQTASSPLHRSHNAMAGQSDNDVDDNSGSEAVKSQARPKSNGRSHRATSPQGRRIQDKSVIAEKATSAPRKQPTVLNGNLHAASTSAVERARRSTPTIDQSSPKQGEKENDGDALSASQTVGTTIVTIRASMHVKPLKSSPSPSRGPRRGSDANGLRKQGQEFSRAATPVEGASNAIQHAPLSFGSRKPSFRPGSTSSRTDVLDEDQHGRSSGLGKSQVVSQKLKQKITKSAGNQSRETNSELARPRAEPVIADIIDSEIQELLHKPDIGSTPSLRPSPSAATKSKNRNSLPTSKLKNEEVTTKPNNPSKREKDGSTRHVTESDEADLQLRSEALQGSIAEDAMLADTEIVFARPTLAASKSKVSALYSGQSLANQVERVLGGYMEEMRSDNEYWTSVALRRARLSPVETETRAEDPTSFANLKPIQFSPHKKGSSTAKSEEVWGIQRMTQDGRPQGPTEVSASYTTFAVDEHDVPDFAHYVSIQNNLLAPNVIHLHCWPYFGENFDMNEAQNLSSQYNVDILARERKILLLLQAQMHENYVESALNDLDCSFADVLRFLLEANPNVGLDPEAIRARQNRGLYCSDDFSRGSERWTAVLSRLPSYTPSNLARVALFCENFQKMAKFSVWHIARKSKFADLPDEEIETAATLPLDDQLTCRICLRFDCPYHGQFKQRPDDDDGDDSDTESISSVDTAVATDIIHPLKVNHRSRVTLVSGANDAAETESTVDPLLRKKQRDQNYWGGYKHKADERGPFYPCHHPGLSCSDAKCSCLAKMIPCEKTCSCSLDCPRKFKGCACGIRKGNQMVCAENPECVCWQNGRECDPDLCGSCGVCDVVDPINKYEDRILIGRCRNASIQRAVPKHTLLGDSGVHGLGLYACEDIKHHHFVGEYKGEIITKKEADRRGAVYEHQKLSYLFSLNKSQEIDSTYFGNKIRFINHAHGEKANLYPRIIMVNTVHRIALYASKDIQAGKELFFDYGPLFPDEQLQGKKGKQSAPESKKSAPHVRNANLVKEFFEVEESEDEDGFLRAKAVSRGRGRPSNKKTRSRATAGKRSQVKVERIEATLQSKAMAEPEQPREREQDAGERLAAFNISDDTPSDLVDADAGAEVEEEEEEEEEDAAFEPDDSESIDSEESSEDSRSDDDDDDEDDIGEARDPVRRGRGRPRGSGISTRKRGRR